VKATTQRNGLGKGRMMKWIAAYCKFSLPDDVTVSKLMIQSCFKPNHQLLVAQPGPYSPMIKIKPLLLDMLLQLSGMNAPVMCIEKG